MGIVVAVFMLLGLLMLSPWDKLSLGAKRYKPSTANFIGTGLLLTGLWNSLWHGLRYIEYFWGIAGLVSGTFMVLVAIMIIKQFGTNILSTLGIIKTLDGVIRPFKILCLIGLLFSFLLYSITLIQLNLGLPILG